MTTNLNLNFVPPLDPDFQPAVLFNRSYIHAANVSGQAVPLVLGLERESGLVSRFETVVRPGADAETLLYVERIVKFLLWARGGWKLHFGGPKVIAEFIRKTYSARGARKFDCEMMEKSYGKKFQVVLTTPGKVPANREMQVAAGGHLKGCRIGFDLGASDYKVSAVVNGEASSPRKRHGRRPRRRIPNIIITVFPQRCTGRRRICRGWTPLAAAPPASSWTTKSAWRCCCAPFRSNFIRRQRGSSNASSKNGTCRWW